MEGKINSIEELYEIVDLFFARDFDLSMELYRERKVAADWVYREIGDELIKVLKLRKNITIKNLIDSRANNSKELSRDVIEFILKNWYPNF